jgi:hypothetical protein
MVQFDTAVESVITVRNKLWIVANFLATDPAGRREMNKRKD